MRTFEEKLAEALRKDREGRGMKNSEITMVRAFQSGKIDEEGRSTKRPRQSEGDSRSDMSVVRDTLWQEEGEQGPPGSGSGYTEGAAVEVVGADGKLVKVVQHSTYATPTAYPTVLRTVNSGVTANLDGNGIKVSNANYEIYLDPAGAMVRFRQNAGPYVIEFDLAALARHLTIRTDDFCDGGVDKSQQHLASVPHT